MPKFRTPKRPATAADVFARALKKHRKEFGGSVTVAEDGGTIRIEIVITSDALHKVITDTAGAIE